ncbi:MAG: hypothetical protein AAFU64_13185, partial [Bacteroidota bacterium]
MDYREEEYKDLDEFIKYKLGGLNIEYEESAWVNLQQKMTQSKPLYARFPFNRAFWGAALLLLMFLVSGTFIALYQMKTPMAGATKGSKSSPAVPTTAPLASPEEIAPKQEVTKNGEGIRPQNLPPTPPQVNKRTDLATSQSLDPTLKPSRAKALSNAPEITSPLIKDQMQEVLSSEKRGALSRGEKNPEVVPSTQKDLAILSSTKNLEKEEPTQANQPLASSLNLNRQEYFQKRGLEAIPLLEQKSTQVLASSIKDELSVHNYQFASRPIQSRPFYRKFYVGWSGGLALNQVETAREQVLSAFSGFSGEWHFGKRFALMSGLSYHEVTFVEARRIIQPAPNY